MLIEQTFPSTSFLERTSTIASILRSIFSSMTLKSLSILNPVNPPHFPPPLILHLSFPKLHNHLITHFGFLFMSSFKKTNYCARSSTLRAKIFRVRPLIVHFPRSRPLH
jgi:hypothetical protein